MLPVSTVSLAVIAAWAVDEQYNVTYNVTLITTHFHFIEVHLSPFLFSQPFVRRANVWIKAIRSPYLDHVKWRVVSTL
jgi:hypothetical protein